MALLSPTLGGSVQAAQPIETPSAMGAVLGLAGSFIGAIPDARPPLASDLEGEALRPFLNSLQTRRDSNMSDQEFVRFARAEARQFATLNPQYIPGVNRALELYGVQQEEIYEAPSYRQITEEALVEFLGTGAGQLALSSNLELNPDGTINEDVTRSGVYNAMLETAAQEQALEDSNRRLTMLQNDNASWQAASETELGNVLPTFIDQNQSEVNSLFALASRGAIEVDTPLEQLNYLNQRKAEAVTRFTAGMRAGNIHPDVYNERLEDITRPYDIWIDVINSKAVSTETMLGAFRNAKELELSEDIYGLVGAIGINPDFLAPIMQSLATDSISAGTFADIAALTKNQAENSWNGLGILPGIVGAVGRGDGDEPTSIQTIAEDSLILGDFVDQLRRDAEERGAEVAYGSRISTASSIVSTTDTTSPEGQATIFRNFADITATAGTSGSPLDTALLSEVYTPTSVRQIQTVVRSGSQEGQDLLSANVSFIAQQLFMNKQVLENVMETGFFQTLNPNSNFTIEEKNGRVVLMENGRESVRTDLSNGLFNDATKMYDAIDNINRLLSVSRSIDTGAPFGAAEVIGMLPVAGVTPAEVSELGAYVNNVGEVNSAEAFENYIAHAIQSESGGNPNARNPESSATGLAQIIDSTWRMLMEKHPDLGLTLDGRTDPVQSERALRVLTQDNMAFLQSNGIPVTEGNLYAAHFLGAGGARTVLTANNGQLLSDLLPARVINSNEFLRGMTVGTFRDWSARKGGAGGVTPTRGPAGSSGTATLPPEQRTPPPAATPPTSFYPEPQAPEARSGGRNANPRSAPTPTEEQASPAPTTASQQANRTAEGGEIQEQSRRILQRLGIAESEIRRFAGPEELSAAMSAGEVKEGDAVIVEGQLVIL